MGKKTDAFMGKISNGLETLAANHKRFTELMVQFDRLNTAYAQGLAAGAKGMDGYMPMVFEGEITYEEALKRNRDYLDKVGKIGDEISEISKKVRGVVNSAQVSMDQVSASIRDFETFVEAKKKNKKNPFKKAKIALTSGKFISKAKKSLSALRLETPQGMERVVILANAVKGSI